MANDLSGYSTGDGASCETVSWTWVGAWVIDAAVCHGGDEPAASSFDTYDAEDVACAVELTCIVVT